MTTHKTYEIRYVYRRGSYVSRDACTIRARSKQQALQKFGKAAHETVLEVKECA